MDGNVFYFEWEVKFMEWLQSLASPLLIKIASVISFFGEELIVVGVLAVIYWCYDKKIAKAVGTSAVFALLACSFIKNIFLRRRPYMDNKSIKCLRPVDASADINDIAAQGYSMPSMHSSNSFTVFSTLAINLKRNIFKIIAAVLIILIGISRVFLGVHYPTDVLLGWAVGAVMTAVSYFLQKKIHNYLILLAIFGGIGAIGWFFAKTNDFFSVYGLLFGILGAFCFEEKFVNFEETESILRKILRLAGGLLVFLVLSTALKLPFSEAFLETNAFVPHLIRTVRYAVSSFAAIGVYPLVFKYTKNIGLKR